MCESFKLEILMNDMSPLDGRQLVELVQIQSSQLNLLVPSSNTGFQARMGHMSDSTLKPSALVRNGDRDIILHDDITKQDLLHIGREKSPGARLRSVTEAEMLWGG